MALSKTSKTEFDSGLINMLNFCMNIEIYKNAKQTEQGFKKLESRINVLEALENRINVLEAQLKREINCSFCQKNRSIMKWVDETTTSSGSTNNDEKPKDSKTKVLKRKHEVLESPINDEVFSIIFVSKQKIVSYSEILAFTKVASTV